MASVADYVIVILIFVFLIVGVLFIIHHLRSMVASAGHMDVEESYCALKVCADGTMAEVKVNYHELSIVNNTDADVRVTLDSEEYLLEPTAKYTGSYGQGHHKILARNTANNDFVKIGFTLRKSDTISIAYVEGKLKFQ